MKKMLYCSILVMTFSPILFAQAPPISATVSIVSDITVYAEPNFRGRTGYFKWVDGNLVPPFPVSNISFTVPNGKIVYIKRCDGPNSSSENAYKNAQTRLNLTGICGIRSDVATHLNVYFHGISTFIHNNDCKRIFGDIKIKIIEMAPGAYPAMSSMTYTSPSLYRGPDLFTFLPFSNANANTSPRYNNHVFDELHRPDVLTVFGDFFGQGLASGDFTVGQNALRDGRVKIAITTNIGSAHKTCDLCDDFSSNVRMRVPVTETIPINIAYGNGRIIDATHKKLVLGPYAAQGSRDGSAITASGGTYKEFRVHLTLDGF